MRILHVINALTSGGAEKLVFDLSQRMNRDCNVVEVLLLSSRNDVYASRLQKLGVKVYQLSNRSVYNIFLIIPLIKFFYRNSFDIVHVHLFPSFYYISFMKKMHVIKCPIIFHEHNTKNRRIESFFLRKIDKLIYSQYSYVICISDAVRAVLMKAYNLPKNKMIVIYNGIDINECKKALPINRKDIDASILEDDILLVMVARFNSQKDHVTLIKALNKLPENFKLLLIGEGDTLNDIKTFVLNLNLSDRVFFLGYRSNPYCYIKSSDIFILSSIFEGFGLSCVEAMACGIPVIASNVPGMAQVVGDVGVLFEVGNSDMLKDKILEVLSFRNNELKIMEFRRSEQFSIDIMIKSLYKIYNKSIC
ncbi:MAG: glycosyltransferase [Prevotella sp.]|nr:glycosyltransferase [Prevotella sp.]